MKARELTIYGGRVPNGIFESQTDEVGRCRKNSIMKIYMVWVTLVKIRTIKSRIR
jgi:hypothetical protein